MRIFDWTSAQAPGPSGPSPIGEQPRRDRHKRQSPVPWPEALHDSPPALPTVRQDTVASSVRESPLLSCQVTVTLSPFLPPLNLKFRNGSLDTAGPHWAVITVLSPCLATTVWMKCAGITLPDASLRWPVSMMWLISTLTSTTPPLSVARMRIGLPM